MNTTDLDINSILIGRTVLTYEQCEKLPTPRLLAYYKKTRKYVMISDGCSYCEEWTDESRQQDRVVDEYLKTIKSMLDKREHVIKK